MFGTNSSCIPQSVYSTDFQQYDLKIKNKMIAPKFLAKSLQRSKYRPIQMDLEILQPFKPEYNVPFNLLHEPKPILQTHPNAPISNLNLNEKSVERKLKIRPAAVYMVPQINLNDVPDDIMYGESGLVSSIYSSDWKKACDFAIRFSSFKPKIEKSFHRNDLENEKMQATRFTFGSTVPPMEIGLSKYVSEWEKQYPKEYVDRSKLFWEKNLNKGICSVCEPQPTVTTLSNDEKVELENCLKDDSLRSPYAVYPPGYTGYIPRLAYGIEFRKKKLTKDDSFVTTLMESQGICK